MIIWAVLLSFVVFLFYVMEFFVAFGLIFVICGSLMSLVYFNQNKLLYMPGKIQFHQVIPDMPHSPSDNPVRFRHPSEQGLDTEDLELVTSDGIKIRGWHVKKEGAKQAIIYFHENAGNIGFRIPLIKELSKGTNSEIILVAYRGYSDSEGYPTEEGLQKDACAIIDYAIDYCEKHSPKLDLFLYGRSLGGAVSVYLASDERYKSKITGVILENTFTSISDMIDAIMPIFKYLKFLQRNHWRSIERIPKIEKPILFIRSLRDEIVPTAQMVRLYESADQTIYTEEYQIEFGTHNSSWEIDRDSYFNKLTSFIQHPQVQREVTEKINTEMKEAYEEKEEKEELL